MSLLNLILETLHGHGTPVTDISEEPGGAVRFTWEGVRFRVTSSDFVEVVQGGCLASNTMEGNLMEAALTAQERVR